MLQRNKKIHLDKEKFCVLRFEYINVHSNNSAMGIAGLLHSPTLGDVDI